MGAFRKAISKVKSEAKTVKKSVSKAKTNFGKKIAAKAVKKIAPKVVKKVAQKAVKKSVPKVVAKKTASKPKAYTSKPKVSISEPKSTAKFKTPQKKQSSFISKLSSGAKSVARDLNPIKTAYAAETTPQKPQAGILTSWADKVQNAFSGNEANANPVNTGSSRDYFGNTLRKWGVNQDYGISEIFGGNAKSLDTVTKPNLVQGITTTVAKAVNPLANTVMSQPALLNPLGSAYKSVTQAMDTARSISQPSGQVLGDSDVGASTQKPNNFSFYQTNAATNPFNTPTQTTDTQTGKLPNFSPTSGEGTTSGGYTFTDGKWSPAGTTQTATDTFAQPNSPSVPSSGQTALDDFYSSLPPEIYGLVAGNDEELQALSDKGMSDYLAGYTSDKGLLDAQAENTRRSLELQYDAILRNYNLIPERERAKADAALNEVRRDLDLNYRQGVESKQAIENSYGENIRAKLKSDKVSKNNLRNMFSSLGTAESSAFIENMTDMESENNREIFLANQEKAGKLGNIDNLVRQAEQIEQDERERITRERDDAIAIAMGDINASEEEKALAIERNNLYALAELSKLQQAKQEYLMSSSESMASLRNNMVQTLVPGIMEQKLLDSQNNVQYNPTGDGTGYAIGSLANGNIKYSDHTIRNKQGVTVGYW